MAVKDLDVCQIRQLIEMIPVVYEGTDNTIVQVLEKLINSKPIDQTERDLIKTWGVKPAPGGGYSAGMCLNYIIRIWLEDRKLIK
jgi:hypothetical protein